MLVKIETSAPQGAEGEGGCSVTTSRIQAVFPAACGRVWAVVTAVEDYAAWRSDVSRVEVLGEGRFVEYTKSGFPTTFTTTVMETCRRWEFDMENANMTGHWTGVFSERDGGTEVVFTESVAAKKWFLRPFVRGYLKRQQARFAADLRAALAKWEGPGGPDQ